MSGSLEAWLQTPVAIIAGMALVTAATRYAGYLLLARVMLSPRTEDALKTVPASTLTAIVAPTVFATDLPEACAAALTIAIAWRFPALAAIVAGVATIAALRQAGF